MTLRFWGAEGAVNTTTASDQTSPVVAGLAGGGYVIAWVDLSTGTSRTVFQIYDAGGNKAGVETVAPASDVFGAQDQVTVAALADGGFLIGQRDFDTLADHDTAAAQFSAAGAFVKHIIFNGTTADSSSPTVAAFQNINLGAVYELGGDIHYSFRDQATGTSIGEATVNTTTAGLQDQAALSSISSGSGLAVVAWRDGAAIRMQFMGGANLLGSEITVASPGAQESVDTPNVLYLTPSLVAVSYIDHVVFGAANNGVIKFYDLNTGSFVKTVNLSASGSEILNVKMLSLNDGHFVALTETLNNGTHIQLLDSSGNTAGPDIVVNTSAGSVGAPSVAALADGRLVVTWASDSGTADTGGFGIYQQIIDPRDGFVQGDASADTLYGNNLFGDDMHGLGGDDALFGLNGDDQMFGGDGNDTMNGGKGDDVGYGGTGNDLLNGATGDDDLSGEGGNDQLRGGLGADLLDGGTGKDTASYVLAKSSVVMSLDGSLVAAGEAAGDTLTGIENLTGSNLAAEGDTLAGNALANSISGLLGNDILLGGGGSDVLSGGRGADTMTGGAGNDRFSYAALNEVGDTITDFSSLAAGDNDVLQFRGSAFGGLGAGALLATQFQSSASDTAATADVRFFYETDTGILRFDADGNLGGSAAIIIATMQPGANMVISDISIT